MNSIYDFIITPTNSRYNNKIKVGEKTLIVNSNIEDHKMVSPLKLSDSSCGVHFVVMFCKKNLI